MCVSAYLCVCVCSFTSRGKGIFLRDFVEFRSNYWAQSHYWQVSQTYQLSNVSKLFQHQMMRMIVNNYMNL